MGNDTQLARWGHLGFLSIGYLDKPMVLSEKGPFLGVRYEGLGQLEMGVFQLGSVSVW